MADGYRISGTGGRRVTETGDARITERFVTAQAGLVATSAGGGVGLIDKAAGTSLSASGIVLLSAARSTPAAVGLMCASQAVAAGLVNRPAAANLFAGASFTPLALRGFSATIDASTASGLSAEGLIYRPGEALLVGGGSSLHAALRFVPAGADLSFRADITAAGAVYKTGYSGLFATAICQGGASRTTPTSVALTAIGGLSSSGLVTKAGEFTFAASTLFSALAVATLSTTAQLAMSGAIALDGAITRQAATSLSSGGAKLTVAQRTVYAIASLSAASGIDARVVIGAVVPVSGSAAVLATPAYYAAGRLSWGGYSAAYASAYATRLGEAHAAVNALLVAGGDRLVPGNAHLTGGGGAISAAGYDREWSAGLFAVAAIEAASTVQTQARFDAGAAALANRAEAVLHINGAVSFSTVSGISARIYRAHNATAYLGPPSARRITFNNDNRVTEDGNQRVSRVSATSDMNISSELTVFGSAIKYHDGDGFNADAELYYHNGVAFVRAPRAYVCISPGEWRRIQ